MVWETLDRFEADSQAACLVENRVAIPRAGNASKPAACTILQGLDHQARMALTTERWLVARGSGPIVEVDETFQIPEPSSLTLAAVGAALATFAWRQRKR